jgi:uncharacterized protein GlcG (DUF336 family)
MRQRVVAGIIVAVVLSFWHAPARAQCAVATDPCLTVQDVMDVARGAVTAVSSNMVVAVTDRGGNVLGVFDKGGLAGTMVVGNFGALVPIEDQAVGLARTASFFSNDQAPLSSRTVRFISGIHFPPGVFNKPPAALYGIENTNRGCDFGFAVGAPVIPRATSVVLGGGVCMAGATAGCGTGIVTGKADLMDSQASAVNGGGVPIFKGGRLAGGIGVAGLPVEQAEFAAFTGTFALGNPLFAPAPLPLPFPFAVILDGVRLPFVTNTSRPQGVGPGVFAGAFIIGPVASPYGAAGPPFGYLFGPVASAVNPQLTAAVVNTITMRAFAQAERTRAAIRLPLGSATRMVIAVGDSAGNILGVFRMRDATIFSIDVAVAKARNAAYFSSPARNGGDIPGVPFGTAVTARTLGFGAMPLFPAGIDNTVPGPFFVNFRRDVATPCSQGLQPVNANQSGIVFFPGSIGLYLNNSTTLVGGLGVSGDGVEQDDLVTAAGVTPDFVAPPSIRADRVILGGVRLPFFKFPRNPEVR